MREEVRAQAQGLLVVFTQGIGFFLSSQIFVNLVYAPMIKKDDSLATWQAFWPLRFGGPPLALGHAYIGSSFALGNGIGPGTILFWQRLVAT